MKKKSSSSYSLSRIKRKQLIDPEEETPIHRVYGNCEITVEEGRAIVEYTTKCSPHKVKQRTLKKEEFARFDEGCTYRMRNASKKNSLVFSSKSTIVK